MSDHDDRPREDAGASRHPDQPDSVLGGFSWDDPAPAQAPGGPAPADQGRSGSSATAGTEGPGQTPAAYPPAAPYPPVQSPSSASAFDPYGTASPPPVPLTKAEPSPSQPSSSPYAAPEQPGYGRPGATSQPYGQQQGYGPSASWTSTPQPYAYGPPPLSPEAEKVRSSAVLWTILNGVAIFLCGNLLSIAGVVLAALAIGKTRDDVQGARGFVRWSWILLAVGFAFWLLIIIGYVVFFLVLGTASLGSGF